MNFALIDWRKMLVIVLLIVAKLLGAEVPDKVLEVGLIGFFGANGAEWIGKGLAAKNGGVA